MLNPFADPPPRLPSPTNARPVHSRNISRSPIRQHRARDFDPLLRDLSPTTTLRAFVADPGQTSESDALATSIRLASVSERALGAKAAQACLDLRSWTEELESWHWPGTFQARDTKDEKARTAIIASTAPEDEGNAGDEENWGSLPARIVRAYENRCDEIGQRLDDIDVEELKDYILASHRAVSRPSSRDDRFDTESAASEVKRLDDYTALVTATILQALPFLTRLNRLLDTWTVRLIILRRAPQYLRDLCQAALDLDRGWAAFAGSTPDHHAHFDRRTMLEMKNRIEQQVGSLGTTLDRLLDDLEGRDDTVPDAWIDDFEQLESTYSAWVVQAERKVLENQWRNTEAILEPTGEPAPGTENTLTSVTFNNPSELEVPALDDDAVMRPSMDGIEDDTRHLEATKPLNAYQNGIENELSNSEPQGRLKPLLIPTVGVASPLYGEPASASISAKSSREGTPVLDSIKDEGTIAKRRNAFLNNAIEANNALKTSKSPVRPFEHASNAFTRLFKKDRSPEQARSKRPVVNRMVSSESVEERAASLERHPLSAVSNASAKMYPISRTGSFPLRSHSNGSRAATPDIDSNDSKTVDPGSQRAMPFESQSTGQENVQKLKNTTVETYKPTGLSSPFPSPERGQTPSDWPLAQPSQTYSSGNPTEDPEPAPSQTAQYSSHAESEIIVPKSSIQSDAFDRMFVENFPGTSVDRPISPSSPRSSRPSSRNSQEQPPSSPRSKHLSRNDYPAGNLDAVSTDTTQPISSMSSRSKETEWHSTGRTSPVARRSKDKRRVEQSSPEISPRQSPSRESNEQHKSTVSPPDAPWLLQPPVPHSELYLDEQEIGRPYPIKRASTASIETFPRSELRSIDVQRPSRHGSLSKKATPPQTPKRTRSTSAVDLMGQEARLGKAVLIDHKGVSSFTSPSPGRRAPSTPPPGQVTPTILQSVVESSPASEYTRESPLMAVDEMTTAAPLNAAMAKRRVKSALRYVSERPGSPSSPPNPRDLPSKKRVSVNPGGDNFDRHVSELLERLPGQIRFRTRPGAETPVFGNSGNTRGGYIAPRPKAPAVRGSPRANMTIAPAESSPKKSSLASDPEVKLYHLMQEGRDEPLKLFVRLVGENERVMVRVGGGWADLADFLRGYAEHHGSRTVSEGGLEVHSMANAQTRKASGPAEFRARTPVASSRPGSSDSEKEWYTHNSPLESSTVNGRQTPIGQSNSTPKSSSSSSSRPSTANASRPPSRQNAGEVGLAGPPSGKKAGLPEHKAKWVEGMIERAKKASAEKSKEDSINHFGELGKAGGTRRVVFRSASGATSVTVDKTK